MMCIVQKRYSKIAKFILSSTNLSLVQRADSSIGRPFIYFEFDIGDSYGRNDCFKR